MEVIRLCRLCLTFSNYHANIFFEKIKDQELWRLVNSICELNTFLYDGLPEHICVDCMDTLKKTLSFRNRAIEATSTLKLMIQKNKDLVPTEEEIDIEEWQMPKEWKRESTDIEEYGIETEFHTNRNIENVDLGSASSKVWEKCEFDALKISKATPKAVLVETPQGTKDVVQPAVATPLSTRSTTVNKVLGVGSVAVASPKKSKSLHSPGKNNQRQRNPPSPGRTRKVKVETRSCDDNKQGPSSEKDPMQQSLSEHQSGTEDKAARLFVCQQCGASYIMKHFLQKHEVTHRNDWTCTTCGLRLRSKRDLNSHMQFHSHFRPYSARSSDLKNFPSLEASEETARNSFKGESRSIATSQDNSIEIRDTNKTINEKDLRVDVVQEEESAGPSKSILNDTKSELSDLKAPVSKSRFICDVCKKCFKRKQNLGNHLRVHYDERPFSCNVCDKTFKWDKNRYHHELRHVRDKISFGKSEKLSKKKQFSCTVCSKNFSLKSGLNVHYNLHSNKFKCNSCGKCFGNNHNLRNHSRIHTKEKPFKCEVCFKCFSMKGSLNRHLCIHSSDKPFSCEICDKRFKRNGDKLIHELSHLRKK